MGRVKGTRHHQGKEGIATPRPEGTREKNGITRAQRNQEARKMADLTGARPQLGTQLLWTMARQREEARGITCPASLPFILISGQCLSLAKPNYKPEVRRAWVM